MDEAAPSAAPPADAPSTLAWRRFWATGVVDTFGSPLTALMAPEGPDSPPLVSHWRQWLRSLADQGELLDIGTGNGALLSHLLVAQPDSSLRGIGVDLSRPTHDWLTAFPPEQSARIECRGGVNVERLPFETGRFAACTSQFGIEYADMSVAMPEVLRVLQRGARIGWVLHHGEGRPARLAREELAHLQWLADRGWFAAAAQALPSFAREPAPTSMNTGPYDPLARVTFDRLVQELKGRAVESLCPDVLRDVLNWTGQCFGLAERDGPSHGLAALDRVAQLLADIRLRLLDLTSHTLDKPAWEALIAWLRSEGVEPHVDTGTLFDRGHLMGWWLNASVAHR